MSFNTRPRDRNVTAVLGPTNTGKTHLAIERMLGHESGLIGLPLRLLAREVYDRIVAKAGAAHVALITGEEKIKPERARYWVSTVEAMPRDIDVEFLAIDEVQLAGDPERGHVFTDRLLHARGTKETLLLGASTMGTAIADLVPGANFISRPRLSRLTYSGQKKITRLPRRTAVVAFSASEVYAIGELMRRQRGGAAVVLGALSPRTRNAQVELYQSGDVDFLVATDAIGMGLNLNVEHVAFSAVRKFDGERHRDLSASELAQIAGRAGRHMNDGTFGVTGSAEPFVPELVEQLEEHNFERLKKLQWRNRKLDLGSLQRLHETLCELPGDQRLIRARPADDQLALETLSRDPEISAMVVSPSAVERLWEVCQVPDYRKISHQNHAELAATLFKHLMAPQGCLPEDWFKAQVDTCASTNGDIDTLSNRIAHIRTWTFVANRADWLKDPGHWQGRTRAIEDKLSDALHEQLTQRFVDKRTSALMRGMRDKDELFAEIADDGAVHVEKHYVGTLHGFRFSAEDQGAGIDGKAARNAAAQVLGPELAMRARRVAAAKAEAFTLSRAGFVIWRDQQIARIAAGDDPLKPALTVLCDEHLGGPDKLKVQTRLDAWLAELIEERLKPLIEIGRAEDISGLARGIAFRLTESFGCLRREDVADEIRALDQPSRAQLRRYGLRFGAFNIYFPFLLKPAAADLLLLLWALKDSAADGIDPDARPEPPRAGLTSLPADPALPPDYYKVSGFHLCGPRAVRVDILERLADLIRTLMAWRPDETKPEPPPAGTTAEGGFTVTPDMMSILGCSGEELGQVLQALGFCAERRRVAEKPDAGEPSAAAAAAAGNAGGGSEGDQTSGQSAAAVQTEAVAVADHAPSPGSAALGEAEVLPSDAPAGVDAAPDAGASSPDAAALAEAQEPEYFEIWRPARRRQGNRQGRQQRSSTGSKPGARTGSARTGSARSGSTRSGSTRTGSTASGSGASARAADAGTRDHDRQTPRDPGSGKGRQDRQDRRPKSGKRGGQDQRSRPQTHRVAPARKPAADPDSPFAALSSLKKKLEKGSQERSSS